MVLLLQGLSTSALLNYINQKSWWKVFGLQKILDRRCIHLKQKFNADGFQSDVTDIIIHQLLLVYNSQHAEYANLPAVGVLLSTI